MFAVIKTGGKQYNVAANATLEVMRLDGAAGDQITFSEVLAMTSEGAMQIGAPFLTGATVVATIVEQTRGPKVIAFKKRRRKHSERKRGHRQDMTRIRIVSIDAG